MAAPVPPLTAPATDLSGLVDLVLLRRFRVTLNTTLLLTSAHTHLTQQSVEDMCGRIVSAIGGTGSSASTAPVDLTDRVRRAA